MGNRESFEKLFKKYYPRLCAYAFELLKSSDDSEDVVSEVFSTIWIKRKKVTIESSLSGYLYKSVFYKCLNYKRKSKAYILPDSLKDLNEYSMVIEEHSQDFPLSEIIRKEKMEALKIAVNKLPAKCRQIFVLSRKFNMKYAEIASLLGISTETVRAQIKIALQKLRQEILQSG